MTIFDTLRYPISNPPTKDELDALPTELYDQWIKSSDWRRIKPDGNILVTTEFIANWYDAMWAVIVKDGAHRIDLHDIENLKRMISEYDNDYISCT